jgi:hypothetical protein
LAAVFAWTGLCRRGAAVVAVVDFVEGVLAEVALATVGFGFAVPEAENSTTARIAAA